MISLSRSEGMHETPEEQDLLDHAKNFLQGTEHQYGKKTRTHHWAIENSSAK